MMKVAECGSSRNTTKSCKSHSSKSQVGLTYQFCKEAQILMQCIHLHCWASQMYHPNLDRGMALWSPQSGRHDRESWRQTPTRFTFYFSLLQKPEISKSKDNDNIYTEDITEQTLNHSFLRVEGTYLPNTAPILNMSVISDVSVNCNGLHSAEISQAWQFKSIYCFTDRSPPFNPPKLLDPCAIYCAGRPHTTNKILTWKRSVDLELNWPTRVGSSIHNCCGFHSDMQEKWVIKSSRELSGIHWKKLEDIVCPHHTIVSHGVSHVVSHGAWHGFGIPQRVWCVWNCSVVTISDHSLTHPLTIELAMPGQLRNIWFQI